jgi:hypothetical protein
MGISLTPNWIFLSGNIMMQIFVPDEKLVNDEG